MILLGRFLTQKLVKGVDIREGPNGDEVQLYIFKFFHEFDLVRIFEGGPWTFDNHLLLWRWLFSGEQLTQITLYDTSIWVQIHDLPIGIITERVCRDIGNFLGSFVEADRANFSGEWRNFFRVRVLLDIRKPLKRRMRIKRPGGEWTWVKFRYERLPSFCFFCGLLGHGVNFCEKRYDASCDLGKLPYGPFLRAAGSRPQHRPGDR